jgi:hypothetical protein
MWAGEARVRHMYQWMTGSIDKKVFLRLSLLGTFFENIDVVCLAPETRNVSLAGCAQPVPTVPFHRQIKARILCACTAERTSGRMSAMGAAAERHVAADF